MIHVHMSGHRVVVQVWWSRGGGPGVVVQGWWSTGVVVQGWWSRGGGPGVVVHGWWSMGGGPGDGGPGDGGPRGRWSRGGGSGGGGPGVVVQGVVVQMRNYTGLSVNSSSLFFLQAIHFLQSRGCLVVCSVSRCGPFCGELYWRHQCGMVHLVGQVEPLSYVRQW